MAKLSLKNIGSLKNVDIELNRINIFIGPQSIGKSTIAKLISFCNWMEKDCVLKQGTSHIDRNYIDQNLIVYHNLEGYFTENSCLDYIGSAVEFHISGKEFSVKKTETFHKAELSKNAYLPSERNMLALPGIFSLKMPYNYLLEFIDDWQEIRSKYTRDEELGLLNLGDSYFFSASDSTDMIHLENGLDIRFSQASSGLQSVTPLCVCIDYLTKWIYNNEENRSAENRKQYRDMMLHKYSEELFNNLDQDGLSKLENVLEKSEEMEKFIHVMKDFKRGDVEYDELNKQYSSILRAMYQGLLYNYKITHPTSTNLVIEEPEQNLFPETQVKLVYYILSKVSHRNLRDTLVITTHSPYVLYAFNNCMLAHMASHDSSEGLEDIANIPKDAWLNPEIVSVWELGGHGDVSVKCIQDERGLVRGNYFDRVMHNVMADFTNLLNVIE
ncbi:MAG: ATP-binding protein [Muribaculaceae bacterium]|nr:ATP-binding protein [Muribaculaceae bacterium]